MLRAPLRLLPGRTIVRVKQGINRGFRWTVGSSVHGCWLGSYEHAKQRALARWVRPGMNACDLGAHAGFYTLALARLVGPRGRVWAFEPWPENLLNLRRHVALNHLDCVETIAAAVCGHTGYTGFLPGRDSSTGCLTSATDSLRVATVTLDALVDERRLPPPDVVKMDIEGAEADALDGARVLLKAGHTIWFISLHGDAQRARCTERLRRAGYRLWMVDGRPWQAAAPGADELVAVPRSVS